MKKENKKNISWRAAEHEHFSRSPGWYFTVGGIALALLILALVTGNFFFGIFIILAFVMLTVFGRTKPQTVDFNLAEDGIGIGLKTFYHYETLEGFAINNRPGRLDEIILKKKTAFNPFVRIPIDSKLAAEAQTFLGEKLPSIEYKESIIDIFSDWLGF